jgi:class 3 adenylate cyclase/tetratricopeptide (TPR) repeat protein
LPCGACGYATATDAAFCARCGASLAPSCPNCGAANAASANFCSRCGQRLGEPGESGAAPATEEVGRTAATAGQSPRSYTPRHLAEKILASRSVLEGERKQVTVLFCDITNSTPLAERLGPEAMHDLLRRFFDVALAQVHRYEGTVNQFLGDGFMALFGAPLAHEDHARRAVLAAWSLQRTLQEQPECLAVRMGLNTGLVVVGSIGDNLRMDYTAIGDTTNLAARLQQLAEPGRILLGESTYNLVRDVVRAEPLGPIQIKGKQEPVATYRLLGLGPSRSPLAARIARHLSRFAGRQRELATLLEVVEAVQRDRGQVVGIVGDPGMGKSRLLYEFRQTIGERSVTYLEGRCVSYGAATPYVPIVDIVRTNCGIVDTDPPEVMAAKVRVALDELGMDVGERGPYLLHLLGLKEGAEELTQLTAPALRERTFETLEQMCLRGARRRPLILGVEDLHWTDNASEAFLTSLVDRLGGAAILLVTTYRPGYRPPWMDKSYATQIGLRQLAPEDGAAVVESVVGGGTVTDEVRQAVLAKAEGNPLFLEELTRVVVDRPDHRHPVPETIRDVLTARIDRLSDVPKRLLQTAAVLGREAPHRLLEAMWEDREPIAPRLAELRRLEFIYEQAAGDDPIYVFKHALTQEVAYESLLDARRRVLHAAAARALESAYVGRLEEVYAALAHHWGRTQDAERAIDYLVRTAMRAARAFAHVEAVRALREALTHVERLPPEQRDRQRIQIVVRLADSQFFLGRYRDNVEMLTTHTAALDALDDGALAGPFFYALALAQSFSGDRDNAGASVMRAAAAALQSGDTRTLAATTLVIGLERQWAGRYAEAVQLRRRVLDLLDSFPPRDSDSVTGHVLAAHDVLNRAYAWLLQAFCLIYTGAFVEADSAVAGMLTVAEAAADSGLQCDALATRAWLETLVGARGGGVATSERAIALSPEPWRTALALGILGYAHLERGDVRQAVAVLDRAVEQADQYRSQQVRSYFRSWLAEAYRQAGRVSDAGGLAKRAHEGAVEARFPWGVALARRAIGRIARAGGDLEEAHAALEDAFRGFTEIEARYDAAWTQVDLALLARAQGDSAAAGTRLDEAIECLRMLGVQQINERVERLARSYELPPVGPGTG